MKTAAHGRRKNEVELVVTKLSNKAREKGLLVPMEIEEACRHLNEGDKAAVVKKLQKLGFEYKEGMLHFNDKVLGDSRIKEKELLSFLIRPEYVHTERTHTQIGAQFYEGIRAIGFPAQVRENWLGG